MVHPTEVNAKMLIEDEGPSLLEYARFHGLARDYRSDDCDLRSLLDCEIDASPDLLGNAPIFIIPEHFLDNEKLLLDADARAFLASIVAMQEDFANVDHFGVRHRKEVRLETPILRTEHALDVRSFGRNLPRPFKTAGLPFAHVVEENGEGFSWPTSYQSLPCQLRKWSQSEKLEMPRPILTYLTSAISDEYPPRNYDEIIAQDLIYRRVSH